MQVRQTVRWISASVDPPNLGSYSYGKGITMRVTSKGQVTIPQRIRDQLGIRPGDEVEFVSEDSLVVLRRIARPEVVAERLALYRGSADAGLSTEEILRLTRT